MLFLLETKELHAAKVLFFLGRGKIVRQNEAASRLQCLSLSFVEGVFSPLVT
jgi:hypothetical protein